MTDSSGTLIDSMRWRRISSRFCMTPSRKQWISNLPSWHVWRGQKLEHDELPDWERAATNTVSWLAEEGFLRYEAAAYGGFVGVRLSMKGLTVLGYIPLSIKSTEMAEPLIVRLKRAVDKGVEGAATDAIKDVLGQVFGLCVRYVVSADKSPGVTV